MRAGLSSTAGGTMPLSACGMSQQQINERPRSPRAQTRLAACHWSPRRHSCTTHSRMDSETCYRRINNFSIFQFEHSIAEMEISVIMCDHHHALPARTQIRQQLTVEDFLIFRILIGCPLIEHVNGSILEIGRA